MDLPNYLGRILNRYRETDILLKILMHYEEAAGILNEHIKNSKLYICVRVRVSILGHVTILVCLFFLF